MKVAHRRTVVIQGNIPANAPFTADINNVYFEPDEVIVRGVTLSYVAGATLHMILSSTLTDNYPMIPLSVDPGDRPYMVGCEIHFPISRKISGQYTFTLTDVFGAQADFQGVLGLVLEFVKY